MHVVPNVNSSDRPAGAGHHGVELLVVDAPVPVLVRLVHHGVALLLRHGLAEVHHHVPQLCPRDEAVTILARQAKGKN